MIRFFIKLFSDLLGFSKSEAKGTLILILIILMGILTLILLPSFFQSKDEIGKNDAEMLNQWVKTVRQKITPKDNFSERKNYSQKKYPEKKSYQYSKKSTKKNFQNYNERKSFKKSEDLSKNEPRKKPNAILITDINTTNEEDLKKIKGIGEKLSQRIIKYRDLLGGFHSMKQLNEVYGLEKEIITKVKNQFEIKTNPKKLNINVDEPKILVKHPYIDWKTANLIVKYRKMHGNYGSLEDLKENKGIKEEIFIKLKPYLH